MPKPTYEELEERLRRLEEAAYLREGCSGKYRGVLEAMGDIVYKLNCGGEFTYVNDSVRNLGYAPAELIGRHFSAIIHPEDVAAVSRQAVLPRYAGKATGDEQAPKLFDERRTGKRMTRQLEVRLIPKGWTALSDSLSCRIGSAIVLGEVTASGEYQEAPGEPAVRLIGSTGLIRDITDHRQAEKALRESECRFRELTGMLPVGVLETDLSGNLTIANNAALALLGLREEDIRANVSILGFMADERAQAGLRRRLDGAEGGEFEFVARRKDGTEFFAAARTNCIVRNKAPAGLRVVVMDISLRKRMEEELVVREKLDALGVLAAGIAHDFNNILSGIVGNISLAASVLDKEAEPADILRQAERACCHATELVGQLSRFADRKIAGGQTADLRSLIRDSVEMALRGSPVISAVDLAEDLWPVGIAEGEMREVINNLVINARQAMPRGGTIRVGAKNLTVDTPSGLPLKPGRYVEFWVDDEGVGIPHEILTKIFDPYYTTKEHGSGLGLAVCYSVIHNYGGHICAASEPGKGSSFHAYVPAPAVGRATPDAEKDRVFFGQGRILVMDDDDLVRYTMEKMLRHLGYTPAVARDGTEAITLYRAAYESGEPFDAVLMDVTIRGGVGGLIAVGELLKIDPHAKAIVLTGYSSHPVLSGYRDHGFVDAFEKPFRVAEVSAVLHRALSGRRIASGIDP